MNLRITSKKGLARPGIQWTKVTEKMTRGGSRRSREGDSDEIGWPEPRWPLKRDEMS